MILSHNKLIPIPKTNNIKQRISTILLAPKAKTTSYQHPDEKNILFCSNLEKPKQTKKHPPNEPNQTKKKYQNQRKKRKRAYPILVNDIDNNHEPPILFAIVDLSNPSNLNVPLERLQHRLKNEKQNNFLLEQENPDGCRNT